MIIRLQDCPQQPWKNGLGSTREIAVRPSAATSETFLWRVSIASVDTAAPFSRFPGIDRHIALLSGNGFGMTLDDGQTHALITPFEPFAFAGEATVAVKLVDGPTRDFNLMVRREQAYGHLEVWRDAQTSQIGADVVLLYCAAGIILVAGVALGAGDSWVSDGEPAQVVFQQGAIALVAHVATR